MTKFKNEKEAKVPVKDVAEVFNHEDVDGIRNSINLYRSIKDQIKDLEEQAKVLANELEAGLIVAGERSLKNGNLTLTRIERSGSKKLAPERVMEKICSRFSAEEATDILQYATIQAQGYSYIQVTAASNEDE